MEDIRPIPKWFIALLVVTGIVIVLALLSKGAELQEWEMEDYEPTTE